ncbi:hypothetical protein HBI56_017110 [Parastagonospora nodorum]|uniref:Uncharacterized protein n=1 Tax=Phaeosphaeria nodorum (strain SN15 / ATCC MYA-4574 / FGSC 10173) TaxID=321614 RepID=A0A7U2F326_PHANO|nr:hypothetical protein HBH56_082890 [Parastagonospora nodorum]QRC96693.1 hypothetical protein JI435_409450 [Parastagonospora nodorum SN15]KAH3929926.1 hypothetical protein HBH54_118940 [Parastagonospora nodorum]KAH3955608.1 hypothetical protein HBH53_005620 [Parastagonospora nodorum]KAH3976818.1 hypothetical protein HBH51_075890 [Parastagonospora nodorum]
MWGFSVELPLERRSSSSYLIIGFIRYQQCYEATACSCSWELPTRATSRFHNNHDARSQIRPLVSQFTVFSDNLHHSDQ